MKNLLHRFTLAIEFGAGLCVSLRFFSLRHTRAFANYIAFLGERTRRLFDQSFWPLCARIQHSSDVSIIANNPICIFRPQELHRTCFPSNNEQPKQILKLHLDAPINRSNCACLDNQSLVAYLCVANHLPSRQFNPSP